MLTAGTFLQSDTPEDAGRTTTMQQARPKPAAPSPELLEAAQHRHCSIYRMSCCDSSSTIRAGPRAAPKEPLRSYWSPYFSAGAARADVFNSSPQSGPKRCLALAKRRLQESSRLLKRQCQRCPRQWPLHCNNSTSFFEIFLETLITADRRREFPHRHHDRPDR
jgi:hypothetical protein